MKKRPLCAICILFLVIQSIRVLFSGVEEMQPSALEKEVSYGEKQVELAGTVYRIEEKKKVTAVFLKDSTVSVAGQMLNESELLVYISKNETEQSTEIKIGNRAAVSGEAEIFETARNPGNFDQKTYYLRQGIHVLVWAEQFRILSLDTKPVRQFLSEVRGSLYFYCRKSIPAVFSFPLKTSRFKKYACCIASAFLLLNRLPKKLALKTPVILLASLNATKV